MQRAVDLFFLIWCSAFIRVGEANEPFHLAVSLQEMLARHAKRRHDTRNADTTRHKTHLAVSLQKKAAIGSDAKKIPGLTMFP